MGERQQSVGVVRHAVYTAGFHGSEPIDLIDVEEHIPAVAKWDNQAYCGVHPPGVVRVVCSCGEHLGFLAARVRGDDGCTCPRAKDPVDLGVDERVRKLGNPKRRYNMQVIHSLVCPVRGGGHVLPEAFGNKVLWANAVRAYSYVNSVWLEGRTDDLCQVIYARTGVLSRDPGALVWELALRLGGCDQFGLIPAEVLASIARSSTLSGGSGFFHRKLFGDLVEKTADVLPYATLGYVAAALVDYSRRRGSAVVAPGSVSFEVPSADGGASVMGVEVVLGHDAVTQCVCGSCDVRDEVTCVVSPVDGSLGDDMASDSGDDECVGLPPAALYGVVGCVDHGRGVAVERRVRDVDEVDFYEERDELRSQIESGELDVGWDY